MAGFLLGAGERGGGREKSCARRKLEPSCSSSPRELKACRQRTSIGASVPPPRTFPSRHRLSTMQNTQRARTHLALTRRAGATVDERRRGRAARGRALVGHRRGRPWHVKRSRSRASRRECSRQPPRAHEQRRTASLIEQARRRHGDARERVDSARGARGQRRGGVLHWLRFFFGPSCQRAAAKKKERPGKKGSF